MPVPTELHGPAIPAPGCISQLAGGVAAPTIFGSLTGNGSNPGPLTIGYYVGAAVMLAGGLIAWLFGVDAERKPLEEIARPVTAVAMPAVQPSGAV